MTNAPESAGGRRRAAANFGPAPEPPRLAPITVVADAETPDTEPQEGAPVEVDAPAADTVAEVKAPKSARSRGAAGGGRAHARGSDKPSVTQEPTGKADQPIQVTLPRSLMERLERFKTEQGLSHPTILFDAIDSTIDRLPDLVQKRTVSVSAPSGKSLFSRPQTVVRRSVGSDAEPKDTFIIRISQENKDILTQLVTETGAPSRTVLLVAAYEAYLPN